MTLRALFFAVPLALALAGCGAGAEETSRPQPPAAATPAPGGGLSVSEALERKTDEPLAVEGALLIERARVQLCEALAESYPPQCAGASLDVVGFDETTVQLEESDDGRVRWADRVALLGHVDGGTLTVSEATSQ